MSGLLADPRAEELGDAVLDFLDIADPAAGANASIPLGGSVEVALLCVKAHFVADGNAANRLVSVDYISRSVTYVRNHAAQVYVASSDTQLQWDTQHTVSDFAANSTTFIPLLPLWLPRGVAAQITVDSVQAGDQLSAIHVTLLRRAPVLN